ncbi:MAG: cytochrome c [Pseudomonadota bacterium]
MRRLGLLLVLLVLVGGLIGWIITAPQTVSEQRLAAMPPGDAARGKLVFLASGCASCHAAEKAQGDAKLVLAGGYRFETPFGTFLAPNISSDKTHGIGDWTLAQFANAVLRGVTPDGSHYYPAFPYAAYQNMTDQDVSDLYVYMKTLPADATPSKPHEVGFPFNIRRGLGVWKALNVKNGWVVADVPKGVDDKAQFERGRYLVEVLAHCGECHTPRDALGGMKRDQWMAGAAAPHGKGRIPNITPHETGIGSWSKQDIIYSLETGFTPEFDSFGSTMADVQLNMAQLPASDREAIALYLKSLPGLQTAK